MPGTPIQGQITSGTPAGSRGGGFVYDPEGYLYEHGYHYGPLNPPGESRRAYNPNSWQAFWGLLSGRLEAGALSPEQAKLLLQYIFSHPELMPFDTGEMLRGGDFGSPTSAAREIKGYLGKLTSIASGRGRGEEGGGGDGGRAVGGEGEGGVPTGFAAIQQFMLETGTSPFEGHEGYLKALLTGNMHEGFNKYGQSLIEELMRSWDIPDDMSNKANLKALENVMPMEIQLRKKQHEENLRKSFKKDYGSAGGPTTAGDSGFGALMTLGSIALPMALGGTAASVGKAIGGGAASAANIASKAAGATTAANMMNLGQVMAGGVNVPSQAFLSSWNIPLAQTFMQKFGTKLGEAGYSMSPNLWGSREAFDKWWNTPNVLELPSSDLGARRVGEMVAGNRAVPSYYPDPWKKQIMWSKLYGQYPPQLQELLRTKLIEYNPYGYGDYYWRF